VWNGKPARNGDFIEENMRMAGTDTVHAWKRRELGTFYWKSQRKRSVGRTVRAGEQQDVRDLNEVR
jgi:hypothetical protein